MKKTSIKLLIMGLVATSLLASCKKNEGNGTFSGEGFKAIIEQGGNTRTHGTLQNAGTVDEHLEVLWTAHDLILVNNGTETRTFELTEGEDTKDGEFYTSEGSTFDFTTGNFYALYPVDGNSISGSTATINLPATQTYSSYANSFGEKSLPMVAHSTDKTLQFKNVLGGICFPMKGNGVTVTRVELTSNDGNDALWGTCTTTIGDDSYPVNTQVSNTDSHKNVISLDCGDGVALDATTPTRFTVMVPPGTMKTGFNVKVYSGSNVLYDKSVDWSASPSENFMERSQVKILSDVIPVTTPLHVTVYSPISITKNSAKTGGSVTGGEHKTLGVIYAKASALSNPVNDLVLGGSGVTELVNTTTGANVVADMSGLESNTIYYVRAYAKTADSEIGMTYYSDPIPFATRKVYDESQNGKLPYPFKVASARQVYFSVGNLQYQASTNTWRFAENQYDFVGSLYGPDPAPIGLVEGSDNHLISATYSGWIDLFAWGTSGYNHNNACYQPWSTLCDDDGDYQKYWAYGDGNANLYDGDGRADWGYNDISNDGSYGEHSGWRVLKGGNPSLGFSDSELYYLLNSRNISKRYMEVRVKVKGNFDHQPNPIALIIFPDNFVWPTETMGSDAAFKFNQTANLDAGENALTEAQWSLLEEKGAALLPAGGSRHGNEVHIQGRQFYYWTSTKMYGTSQMGPALKRAWALDGGNGYVNPTYNEHVTGGQSVRLVRE